jgi:hypothetical protein
MENKFFGDVDRGKEIFKQIERKVKGQQQSNSEIIKDVRQNPRN